MPRISFLLQTRALPLSGQSREDNRVLRLSRGLLLFLNLGFSVLSLWRRTGLLIVNVHF